MINRKIASTYCIFFALFSVLFFAACATVGYENVDTTRKAILVGIAETQSANLLLQDLIRRDVIDDNSAREALDALRRAMRNLQVGLNAIDVDNDPLTAENTLALANASLNIALVLLANFTGEP